MPDGLRASVGADDGLFSTAASPRLRREKHNVALATHRLFALQDTLLLNSLGNVVIRRHSCRSQRRAVCRSCRRRKVVESPFGVVSLSVPPVALPAVPRSVFDCVTSRTSARQVSAAACMRSKRRSASRKQCCKQRWTGVRCDKAQTPLVRSVVDLFYSKCTTNRTSGVWA